MRRSQPATSATPATSTTSVDRLRPGLAPRVSWLSPFTAGGRGRGGVEMVFIDGIGPYVYSVGLVLTVIPQRTYGKRCQTYDYDCSWTGT